MQEVFELQTPKYHKTVYHNGRSMQFDMDRNRAIIRPVGSTWWRWGTTPVRILAPKYVGAKTVQCALEDGTVLNIPTNQLYPFPRS